jgi:hypothetical protein
LRGSEVSSLERKSLPSLEGKKISCLLLSSSLSFCETRKERKILFEAGQVKEFPDWKE